MFEDTHTKKLVRLSAD